MLAAGAVAALALDVRLAGRLRVLPLQLLPSGADQPAAFRRGLVCPAAVGGGSRAAPADRARIDRELRSEIEEVGPELLGLARGIEGIRGIQELRKDAGVVGLLPGSREVRQPAELARMTGRAFADKG